jgi:serine/threonine protein kinase
MATTRISESTSLFSQLSAAEAVVLHNGWANASQVESWKAQAMNAPEPLPAAGRSVLATFLVERRFLARDQANDLDSILRQQATLPNFQLMRKLGSGGMGTVFLAVHLASGRQVALKTINTRLADEADFVNRFHREAKALGSVHHRSIAEIVESGEVDGHCYMAMEFIEGPSLMALLKEYHVLPEPYALGLARQVAEGLAHVWNSAQLVHRDIKPENVLVIRKRDGDVMFPLTDEAKLIDFGLVKSNSEDDRLTQTGMTIGTPLYMSPEQVRGEKLDCRSDIYGLGATLYHLLTGSTPFIGTSPGAIMSAHLTEDVPDPGARVPSLHAGTRELVMMAMAKDTAKRFLTFEGMVNAIDKVMADIGHKVADSPRLLRKPMVLKNPTPARRTGDTDRIQKPAAAPAAAPGAAPTPVATGEVPRKVDSGVHRNNHGKPVTAATQRSARPPADQQKPPTTAVRASSDRIERPVAAPAAAAPAQATTKPPSAAYVDDVDRPAGVGLLPWIALGGAILALVAYLIASRF